VLYLEGSKGFGGAFGLRWEEYEEVWPFSRDCIGVIAAEVDALVGTV
jgi:hypothetical protein